MSMKRFQHYDMKYIQKYQYNITFIITIMAIGLKYALF